jgi:chromosome segregation ATPase
MELKVAINRAIDECIEEDCLKELLTKSRLEVLELMMDTYSFENYQKIVEYERNKAEIENQELKSKLAEREEEKQQLESKLTEREEEKQQLESKLTEREEEKQQLQEEKQNLILLSIEMALKMTGDEELSINEVAEKVPNLTVEEIKSIWDEYKKNKDI